MLRLSEFVWILVFLLAETNVHIINANYRLTENIENTPVLHIFYDLLLISVIILYCSKILDLI